MSGTTLTLVRQADNKMNDKCFQIVIPCDIVHCNVIKKIKIAPFNGKMGFCKTKTRQSTKVDCCQKL